MEIPDLLKEVSEKYRRLKQLEAEAQQARAELTLAIRKASQAGSSYELMAKMLNLSRQRVQTMAERAIDEDDAAKGLLTSRELEILTLIAEGHSNSEVARMLWLSAQTIKFHLVNLYRKLGVSNRREAGERARELGLLPNRPDRSLTEQDDPPALTNTG